MLTKMLTKRQIFAIRMKDIFDSETGLFAFMMDKKCFAKKHAARANRLFPRMSLAELLDMAENAKRLHEGVADELLIELARRLKKCP